MNDSLTSRDERQQCQVRGTQGPTRAKVLLAVTPEKCQRQAVYQNVPGRGVDHGKRKRQKLEHQVPPKLCARIVEMKLLHTSSQVWHAIWIEL